jgi:RHS repeat-associated protein
MRVVSTTIRPPQVYSRRDFMPFGESLGSLITPERSIYIGYGPDSVRKKFTGYERDDETALDFAQNRFLAFQFGRFTSVDIVGGTLTDPQSLNKYSYVLGNPVNLIDPYGLCGTTPSSSDGSKCIWLRRGSDEYKSVSETEYGDGSGFDGWEKVKDPEKVNFVLENLNGDYANSDYYKSLKGSRVGLGADGMFQSWIGPPPPLVLTQIDPSLARDSFRFARFLEGLVGQDILPDSIELAGGVLGAGGSIKITRDGDVFGGGDFNLFDSGASPATIYNLARKGKVLPSASLFANKTLRFGRLTKKERRNIEGGPALGLGGGADGVGGQISYLPSTGDVVVSGGFATPGLYAGGTYHSNDPLISLPVGW